jgi:hypothetical protein
MIVECNICEAQVDAQEVGHFEYGPSPDGEPPGRYSLLRCPRCSQAFLVSQEYYHGEELSDPYRLYPTSRHQLSFMIQGPIREAFTEALRCFKCKAYTATAIMCRKTLECVCAEHEAKGKTLAAKLSYLKEQGAIESGLLQWADELRLAGNHAAHEVAESVSREDAGDMIEFSHALIEYLFTYRHRFDEFRRRRAAGPRS